MLLADAKRSQMFGNPPVHLRVRREALQQTSWSLGVVASLGFGALQ